MKNNLMVPIAIIIAGALIAGAVFINSSGNNNNGNGGGDNNDSNTPVEIDLNPVTDDDHILGSPNAEIILVEYSDLECPFCKEFHSVMQNVIDKYGSTGEVAWVYRHFPLVSLHSKAPKEAEATECAAELGGEETFWAYTDRIYEITPSNDGLDLSRLPEIAEEVGLDRTQFETCLDSGRMSAEVENDFNDARKAGGTGTPYNVLVLENPVTENAESLFEQINTRYNGSLIKVSEDKMKVSVGGGVPFEIMSSIIDALLAQ